MAPANSKIQQLIESLTQDVLLEVLRGFKFNQFKTMDDQTKRIKYADEHLPRLGTGSSRTVYALGSNKVLKVAGGLWPRDEPDLARAWPQTTQRGRAQNEQEVNLFTNPKIRPVVAEIYDFAKDFTWITSELVRPFRNEEEFLDAVGVDDWTFGLVVEKYGSRAARLDLEKAVDWAAKHMWKEVTKYGMPLPDAASDVESLEELRNWMMELFTTNDFLKNALHLIELGSSSGDLTVWNHWGKTVDGDVKLLDYGVTSDIIKRLY